MLKAIALSSVFLLGQFGLSLAMPGQAQAAADHVVINEVQIYGYDGAGGTEDDWVELYNPTASDVALDGWTLQKFSYSGNIGYKQALSGTVKAGGYFLVVREDTNTNLDLLALADLRANASFSLAQDNIIVLANDDVTAVPATPGTHVVDFVGFGNANYYEGMAAAPAIGSYKSISRSPDGTDTDDNGADFTLRDVPTPQNSGGGSTGGDYGLEGTVELTITPGTEPVRNLTPISAEIVFTVNGSGIAIVKYGLDASYGQMSASAAVTANEETVIGLAGLECATTYHYSISAENTAGNDTDDTADAVFTTQPCGLGLDHLAMIKASARANDAYADGWAWEFDLTVWDPAETVLFLQFDPWTGTGGTVAAGGNMRYSADNGASWTEIAADSAYPLIGADIGALDENPTAAGRQLKVLVQMKVPVGTSAGTYGSNYVIRLDPAL